MMDNKIESGKEKMSFMKYVLLDIKSIDFTDQFYRYSSEKDLSPLTESIRKVGIVSPLIVEYKARSAYRLVTGFRRFQCLRNLNLQKFPALVADSAHSEEELLQISLQENLSVRSLNPVEISSLIQLLENNFSQTKEGIVKNYFPLLGRGRNPRVYDLYKPLKILPHEWQQAIIDEDVAVETAFEIAHEPRDVQLAFLDLIQSLRLGRNRQREFWMLIKDIARIQNREIVKFLDSQNLREIVTSEKLTPAQKTERYKTELWKLRYPRYSEVKEKYEALLRRAKLPPDVHLQPPSYFEGEKFSLTMTFKTVDDLAEKLKILERNNVDVFQKMIDLI